MSKPKVGDMLHLVNEGQNVRNYRREPIDVPVEKVGRKYVYANGIKFNLRDSPPYFEATDYAASWTLYASKEDKDRQDEKGALLATLRAALDWGSSHKFTLEQLREVEGALKVTCRVKGCHLPQRHVQEDDIPQPVCKLHAHQFTEYGTDLTFKGES